MSMSFTTTIGLIAGVCTTGSILPQVIKALKTRHTRDISLLLNPGHIIMAHIWLYAP